MAETELLRCYHCSTIITGVALRKTGKCRKCPSRRFRYAMHIEDEEVSVLKRMGYDPAEYGWEEAPDDPEAAVQ